MNTKIGFCSHQPIIIVVDITNIQAWGSLGEFLELINLHRRKRLVVPTPGRKHNISKEIYGLPFVLYDQDETTIFTTQDQVISFLKNNFNQLEENNYGYSITNSFEHYKENNNVIIIEMNFTRFLKDGSIMGDKERKASYILKNIDGSFKIVALIPHSPLAE